MLNVVGVVILAAFYLAVLGVGIAATWWFKKKNKQEFSEEDETETSIVAGRKLGGLVGVFTMTATTVGGGFINGTAESIATQGLVWTLAPFGIFVGLIIGGLIFAPPMRKCKYVTMFDPFQNRYHGLMIVLLYLATILGDVFWSASILAALGTSLSVILELNVSVAIITSAGISVLYTMFGQMVAVAYTDIIQLIFITIGLAVSIPFAISSTAVGSLLESRDNWLGKLDSEFGGVWADLLFAMTLGTIPWQTYFQRVLSVKSVRQAQILSVAGACGALLLSIPPVLVGVVSVSTNWTETELGNPPEDPSQTLPLVLFYLTPTTVSLFGLCAVSAAVMSSIDSAILASSSLFVQNIYRAHVRKQAGTTELFWVQRMSIVVIGAAATVLAIFADSVYGMFIMAADIVYVILFPQLVAIIFSSYSNTYGAIIGYFVGLILRLGAGEPLLNLDPVIFYPYFDSDLGQLFPFRTFAMLCSLLCILGFSKLLELLFTRCNEEEYLLRLCSVS